MQMKCRHCEDEIIGSMEQRDESGNFHKGCASMLCKECGWCCTIMLIPTRFEWTDMDSRVFYEKRGVQVVKDNMGGITLVIDIGVCPQWKEGEGCTVYVNRPYWCRIYEPKNDPFHAAVCPLTSDFEGEAPKK